MKMHDTNTLPKSRTRILFCVAYDENRDRNNVWYTGYFNLSANNKPVFINDDFEGILTDSIYNVDNVVGWVYINELGLEV